MNDLKRLYQKPVTTQIKELKGNVSEDYDTLEEVAQAATNIPVASAQTLGGVKVGSGLAITEQGVLSASGGGGALIVVGTLNETTFTPDEGQPTFSEAVAAILQGRDVIINDGGFSYYHWAVCLPEDNRIDFNGPSNQYVSWIGE